MTRLIQGIPLSWDPSIANLRFPGRICATAWSSCSRFIATAWIGSSEIAIMDAVTLEELHTMYSPQERILWTHVTFSPGTNLLTAYSLGQGCIISWDLRTGGLLSNINTRGNSRCISISHSMCETMIGGSFKNNTILIYNALSGTCILSLPIQQLLVGTIWTHDEYLQFATVEQRSIILWQVSFTSNHIPAEVGSLSIPDNFSQEGFVLLSTLSKVAFIHKKKVVVWDPQNEKVLLDSTDIEGPRAISFSSGGHFFVCGTEGREFYIWKESPTGYLPHEKFVSGASETTPLVSPNGETVISSSDKILQLAYNKLSYLPLQCSYTSFPVQWMVFGRIFP